jgi:1-phosphofructokinase family hexose kinase
MVNTLTLNPAIDRVLYLDSLRKNVTNRIEGVAEVIGGKGTHVSINLKILGLGNRAFGICHGEPGRRIIRYLEDYGLEVEFIHREGAASRTNYLIVERSNDCTIVAEKGVPLGPEDLADIVASLEAKTSPGDCLVLSGDAGNCPNPFVYNDIALALRGKGLRVFIDTSGPALAKCVELSPFLIKPNLSELSFLCGREVACEDGDLLRALESLDEYGVQVIAVSLGSEGSIMKCPEGLYRARPPAVRVRNTIGCGDCFLAALVYGISEGRPYEETLRVATAASAATAESSLSVGFDPGRAAELAPGCDLRRIG